MKIIIDKSSIISVFTIAFYVLSGGDYDTVKDTVNELLERIYYEPYKGRPKGKWIVNSNGTTNYYACDKCGSAGDIQDKFCRECGADMRGD